MDSWVLLTAGIFRFNSSHCEMAFSMNEKRVNKKVTMTVPIVLNELFLGESFHGLIQDVRLYSTFMAGISFQDNPASKLI